MMSTLRSTSWLPALVAPIVLASCGGGDGPSGPSPGPPPPPPPPPPGASLDLSPAEVRTLTDPAAIRAFELTGASEPREYQVIVMSGSRTEGSAVPVRFSARAADASAAVAPRPVRPGASASAAGIASEGAGLDAHERLRVESTRELVRLGARPARPRASAVSLSLAPRVPTVGEAVTIRSAILPGGTLDCFSSTPIDGTVRAVGQNFAIVEDDAAAGLLTPADFADLDRELDDFVAPADQDYFGQPADLDGNGRTIAFFTRQVNRLTPEGSTGVVIGFFTNVDLADRQDCPSSNEAEIIWLIAPDPDGEVGPAISAAFVKSIARGLVAHEFQHLLNAQRRVTLGSGTFSDTEDIWLNEGLSHIGEEVSGFHRLGLATRANLGFAEIGIGTLERAAFEDFHAANFRNVGSYLESPNTTPSLATSAPEGSASFAMRGFGYLFLRWLGDRYGPPTGGGVVPGSGERDLFREITSGGPAHLTGIDNVLRAINVVSGESPAWGDVLAEYFAAPAVDDVLSSLPGSIQFSTWDYPRLWQEFSSNSLPGLSSGDPLLRTRIAVGPGAASVSTFDLGASTARYFTFRADGAHPSMRVELTGSRGLNLPNGAGVRVVVVRTR